jgi:predicted metal-dependent phosphotriesterase family hydrolase
MALLAGLSAATQEFIQKVLVPNFHGEGFEVEAALERIRTKNPARTFRDAMHTIAWVWI